MDERSLLQEVLMRPVAYHAPVAKAFGSVKLAVMWSQLFYWSARTTDPDGWIYKTQSEMFDETGLSRKEQETARAIGRKLGVIEEKKKGVPCKVHFRIRMARSLEVLSEYNVKHGKEVPEDKPVEGKKEKSITVAGEQMTPREYAKKFFDQGMAVISKEKYEGDPKELQEIAKWLGTTYGAELAKKEMAAFILYWTEPTPGGKKQKWETRDTFELKRRILRWMTDKRFSPSSGGSKGHKQGMDI